MQREIPAEMAERFRRAAEVFADVGFEHARIDDLSVATGVPSSTIYYYLAGKEGLLAFLLTDWLEAVASAVEDVMSASAGASVRQRLTAIIRVQVELMDDHPATCRVLLAENGRIARLPELGEAVEAAFHRPVEKVLRDGLDDGTLRPIDPGATAAAVYGALTLGGLSYLVRGHAIPSDFVDSIAALVFDGITPR